MAVSSDNFSQRWSYVRICSNGAIVALMVGLSGLIGGTYCLVRASIILGQICVELSRGQLSADWHTTAALFLCFELGSVALQFLGRWSLANGSNRALLNLRVELFRKLDRLPLGYFDRQPVGKIITRLTNDVEGMEAFFGGALARIGTAVSQIIIVLVSAVVLAPAFGLAVVAAALPSLCLSWLTRGPIRYWLNENKSRNAQLNATLAEFIQGLGVLRVSGSEEWSQSEFAREANHHYQSSMKVLSWNSLVRPLTVLFSMLPTFVTALVGGLFLRNGQIELGIVIALLRLTERFSSPVRVLTQEIQVIQDALASSRRVFEMLGDSDERVTTRGGHKGVVRGEIEFDGVSLRYEEQGRSVLEKLSLVIPAGQKVGILGETGSGKTTLVNLIPALYMPYSGSVKIDGVSTCDWDLPSLRGQIGYLAQDSFLFQGTLLENILGSSDSADDDKRSRVINELRESGLMPVIDRFADGLEHVVSEGGSNLSAGERQMIAILRLLSDARPIIILDEATSCLDRSWEKLVQKSILAILNKRNSTCLMIAHRIETLKSCDRLITIERGRVVADVLTKNHSS